MRALIDEGLAGRLRFSDHALVRFGERAGLPSRERRTLEPLLRDLLAQEGRVVARRPQWSRSRNTADAYVQVGDWLLLICRHDVRRPGAMTVVTVVSRAQAPTWERARERGFVGTPPPLPARRPRRLRMRVGLAGVVAAAAADESGRGGWVVARVAAELRRRRAAARERHREAVEEYEALVAGHEEQRRSAREGSGRRGAR